MVDSNQVPSGPKYALRQHQLFGPWGVGSILPCPDGNSVMIAGLDAFPYQRDPDDGMQMSVIHDPRLARYIGVSRLLAPPLRATVPSVRFPKWRYCPSAKCGKMSKTKPGAPQSKRCDCAAHPVLVPERFIVVCPEGHIDDFPIMEWVHEGPVNDQGNHTIRRQTRGLSSSLSDIEYICSCGKRKSLKDATRPGELARIGYTCKGSRPWLDENGGPRSAPADQLQVVQRGGTNVWYSDVVSSIYIPEGNDQKLDNIIDDSFEDLKQGYELGSAQFDFVCQMIAKGYNYTADNIASAFQDRLINRDDSPCTDSGYKLVEYETLKNAPAIAQKKGIFEGSRLSKDEYSSECMNELVVSTTLVTTLKESRALVGFSRLYPDANEGKSFAERRNQLSRKKLSWTLGVQMTGEGIFLSFDKDAIDSWASTPSVKERIAILQANLDRFKHERGEESKKVNPAFVLIHTLSHLLMLQITKECGYSTASVKERIYCDKFIVDDDRHEAMLGLLIYTASDDSEGSLGGLVRSGRPGHFEAIFEKAIEQARWCSSDPVCIESRGQGLGSCNLSACYSCTLVPETSCENRNQLLDRALIVGLIEQPSVGFFSNTGTTSATGDGPKDTEASATYTIDFDDVPDVSDETFKGRCEFLAYDASDLEKQFLDHLSSLPGSDYLEKPFPYVQFHRDNHTAEASLTWPNSKVVFLTTEDAEFFEDSFGHDYKSTSDWKFFTIDDVQSAEEFSSAIEKEL